MNVKYVRPKSIREHNQLYTIVQGVWPNQKILKDNLTLRQTVRYLKKQRKLQTEHIWATRALNMINLILAEDAK